MLHQERGKNPHMNKVSKREKRSGAPEKEGGGGKRIITTKENRETLCAFVDKDREGGGRPD